MIKIQKFIDEFKKNNLNFSTGVPDSLFKNLCYGFERNFKEKNIIAANEGSAVAIGIDIIYQVKNSNCVYAKLRS